LLGLPGSGKWYLARQLMADDSHDRERVLGLSMLPVAVDCRAISAGDQPLWLAFARRLLLAMSEAADRAGYTSAARELAALPAAFDRHPPTHPDETMSAFQRAFEALINDALQSPLLVLTNFDSVYSELEPAMLYCLARFRSEWHDVSERIYLVIATWRPLSRLRDDAARDPDADPAGRDADADAGFVREFSHVFADAAIPLNYRGQFRALWESLTGGRPLDARTEELLLRLTGANPGLLRDVLRRAQLRGWLDDPARLAERLAAERWADAPLPTCDKIWRALRPEERDCLVGLAEGRRIDINREQELARLGLLDADGHIFSDVFAATIGRFRAEEERHERGLRIDPANRRVTVDGRPVALRDGREMDILLALYARRGQVVRYRELVEAIYGEPNLAYDEAMFFSDKEALQRAIARLCERIDPQRAYLTNKHGVGYTLSAAVA
jgi:DNA-binding winged helix-turn-helix (wHTH) protein